MQISLSLRLDTTRDRFVIDLGPEAAEGEPREEREIRVEGMPEPVVLTLTKAGAIEEIAIPGLKKILAAIAGEKPEGKPAGKPPR